MVDDREEFPSEEGSTGVGGQAPRARQDQPRNPPQVAQEAGAGQDTAQRLDEPGAPAEEVANPSGEPEEPATAQLPLHWTEPPTGEIPAVLQAAAEELQEPRHQVAWRSVEDWDEPETSLLPEAPTDPGAFAEEVAQEGHGSEPDPTAHEGAAPEPGDASAQEQLAPSRGSRMSSTLARVVTGASFAALFGGAMLAGPAWTLAAMTVLSCVAAAEFSSAYARARRAVAPVIAVGGVASIDLAAYFKGTQSALLVAAFWFMAAFAWPMLASSPRPGTGSLAASRTALALAWIGVLGAFGTLLVSPAFLPSRHGLAYLAAALLAAISNDVGAYFGGRASPWLKGKMAPSLSPNKTWAGAIAGTAATFLATAVISAVMHPLTEAFGMALAAGVSALSPLGDLFESMIKRDLGLKDMGDVLPGHGGLLDRVDGILFALPFAFFLVQVMGLQ